MELNVHEDHMNLVLWIRTKYPVSSVIGSLKKKTALRLFQSYDRLGKDIGSGICGVAVIVLSTGG